MTLLLKAETATQKDSHDTQEFGSTFQELFSLIVYITLDYQLLLLLIMFISFISLITYDNTALLCTHYFIYVTWHS